MWLASACIVLSLAVSHDPVHANGSNAVSQHKQQQAANAPLNKPVVSANHDTKKNGEKPAKASRPPRPLSACQRFQQWFRALKDAEFIGFLAFCITTLYLVFTVLIWLQMLRANKQAEKAYEDSQRSAKILERAYILVTDDPILYETVSISTIFGFGLKNFGRTPAINFTYTIKLEILLWLNGVSEKKEIFRAGVPMVLGPNDFKNVHLPLRELATQEMIDDINAANGRAILRLACEVRYGDMFGEHHSVGVKGPFVKPSFRLSHTVAT